MGRRVVVTGGSGGIGRACAARFLQDGASVVLVGRREGALLEAAATLGREYGDAQLTTLQGDLSLPADVARVATTLTDGPQVHVLVLNAGGNFAGDVDDAQDLASRLDQLAAAWRADFDGNVLTTVLLAEALLPHILRPGGRIVAMSSVAGLRGAGAYGAAKAAVNAWMWSMATALAREGVTVNAVAPGFVPDTGFWEQRLRDDPTLGASRLAGIPMGRAGTPQEVAEAVAYLASPDAGWTSGQILSVNGAVLLGRG